MAIHPLGKETALLLRASALVVTPLSLIKELVDNAIDAKATSVKVQMARNGVNQIEVQDNGVGISPGDFDALGRRAHTSKLRAFQDLPRVGGTSLGFRGEALAAANSFAEVTITTRTAQEKVGHRVCLEPKGGGVKRHDLAPAPVGTTVRVQNLFANIPVRKKVTSENIQKSITDIKHLLQAYALARPQIRLSFGVTGDNKAPWSYSPVGTPTVREAAFQILGKDLASQYANVTMAELASSPDNKLVEELTEHEVSQITVDAYLPKQDADLSTGCKKGTYISVDGRPMAPGRGTMKKVVAAFRARFESHHRRQGTQPSAASAFIQLDIRCPPGIYDINVSPAKDEVMFTDESRVLKAVDHLLETHYPAIKTVGHSDGGDDGELDGLSPEDFRLLSSIALESESSPGPVDSFQPSLVGSRLNPELVPDESHEPTSSPDVEEIASNPKDANVNPDTVWLIDMSNPCDDDDVPQRTAASVIDQLRTAANQQIQKPAKQPDVEEGRDRGSPLVQSMTPETRQDGTWPPGPWMPAANASNPWIIAAESAKAKQAYPGPGSFTTNSAFDLEVEEADPVIPADLRLARSVTMFPFSPSPEILPPMGAGLCTPPRMMLPPTAGALRTPPSSDGRNPRQRNALPLFKPPTMTGPRDRQPQASRPRARPQQGQQPMEPLIHGAFGSPTMTGPRDRQSQPPSPRARPQHGPNHGAFGRPYDEYQDQNSLPLDSYMVSMDARALQPSPEPSPFPSPPLFAATNHPAVEMPKTDAFPLIGSVEINDEGALGGHTTMDAAPANETADEHDPRKYLMRRRRSMSRDKKAGRMLRRVKSSLLPLETTPVELEMHTVAHNISTSHADLRAPVLFLVGIDRYVTMGDPRFGLPDDLEGAADVQARLQRVCGEWAQRTTGTKCDLQLNLRGMMKGKCSG